MTIKRSSVVFAGLLGGAATMAPQLALAEGSEGSSLVGSTAFWLGSCAAGCALVACVALALSARRDRLDEELDSFEDEVDAEAEESSKSEHEHQARSTYAPRHMSAEEWERTGTIHVRKPEPGEKGRQMGAHAVGNAPKHATHAAKDYEDIADNYVKKQSFRELMATRAQGVAATLAARIGENKMDGLPVIERADGSVGDVGTSWWNNAVGASVSGPIPVDESIFGETVAIPMDFDDLEFMPAASAGTQVASSGSMYAAGEGQSRSSDRASDISHRVALVDEGVYPEERSVDDVTTDDWERALAAMDEHIAAIPLEPFSDAAGGIDSIDDPDGLEGDTRFLHFRTPAGHPEVVDTDSYVDYLVAEECSRNPAPAVRRASRDFLRVIEGGTSASSTRSAARRNARHFKDDDTLDAKPGHRPRHFDEADTEAYLEALEA